MEDVNEGMVKEEQKGSGPAQEAAVADIAVQIPLPSRPVLPQPTSEKERRARARIDADLYDTEAWVMLAAEAQARPAADGAPLFEYLLATFPTAARYWKMYAEAQIAAGNHEAVKAIFSRCLLSCLHVDLWRSYLKYIRQTNDSRGAEGREEAKKAYEFTVDQVGFDIGAAPVWQEYIAYQKAAPASTPAEESQRILSVRKVYQRAVLVPMHGIEQLWKDYEQYENSLNRALAKGLLAEMQPRYMSARAVYRERKKLMESINLNSLPTPPGASKEEGQSFAWRAVIAFEVGNPQRLEAGALAARVTFTFEQCLMLLPHYPDIWYSYATWHAERGAAEAAVAVFQRARKALPGSAVLSYAYAEFEEARGNAKEARAVYDAMLENDATANALAHIQLMRFVRRVEDREAARKVFMAARKSPVCTFQVYIAAALLELYVDKDAKVARNIFELGLKKFIHEPAYVLEYLDFLQQLNDERNMRVLFERALSVLPAEESVEVWNRFVAFENLFGDLKSILNVTARRRAALKDCNEAAVPDEGLQAVVERYRYLDLWPCSSADLNHLAKQQMMSKRGAGKAAPPQPAAPPAAASSQPSTSPPPLPEVRMNVARPDLTSMVVYDPRSNMGAPIQGRMLTAVNPSLPFGPPVMGTAPPGMPPMQMQPPLPPGPPPASAQASLVASGGLPPRPPLVPQPPPGPPPPSALRPAGFDDSSGASQLPPALAYFLSILPAVQGPIPDVDMVLAVLAQADLSQASAGAETGPSSQQPSIAPSPAPPAPQPPSNSRSSLPTKRKEPEPRKTEEDPSIPVVQNRPPPRDIFRLRQMQRAKGASASGGGASTGPSD